MKRKIYIFFGIIITIAIWSTKPENFFTDLVHYTTDDNSGFINKSQEYNPLYKLTKGSRDKTIIIPDIKNKTIIIYNHGTLNSYKKENCNSWWKYIPQRFYDLSNDNTLVYYLCSQVTDKDNPGTYTNRRAKEIETLLDKFIALGIKPKNIFLAGHSAGGWAILLMDKKQKQKFNSFFITSPACCGKKENQRKRKKSNPYNLMHTRQIKKFNTLPQKGIIFTAPYDRWITQDDFIEFKKFHNKKVRFYDFKCEQGHKSNRLNCMGKTITKIIRKYINENK